VTFKITFDDWK